MANTQENLIARQIFKNKVIALGSTEISQAIDVEQEKLIGNLTVQIELTGTGTLELQVEQSNNFDKETGAGDWVKSSDGHIIVSGFTVTSGVSGDGKDLLNIPIFNSKFFRIVPIETGAANPITLNAWLNLQ